MANYLPTSAVMFGPKKEVNFAYQNKIFMLSFNLMFFYFLETTFDEKLIKLFSYAPSRLVRRLLVYESKSYLSFFKI